MKTSTGKINFLQVFMIMMLFNGLLSHVILNPIMLDVSGRDAWISVLLTALVYIPWCVLLVYIMRKAGGQKLQPWLAKQTTPFMSWLILVPVILQLFLIGFLTIIQTSIWTISNYLPETPQFVLIIVLIIVCHYAAKQGINTIAIGAGVLLPAVVVLGYFVSIVNMPEKDWVLLTPMLENGWDPALKGMIYAGGAFVELSLLLLLQHRMKKRIRTWQLILLGLVLVYITLGPLIGAITEFGPVEASLQLVSPYEQWRLVKLGDYIEHVDFFSIFQWLAGATIRISLAQFLLTDLVSFRKPESRSRFIFIITISFILMACMTSRFGSINLGMFESYLVISLIITMILSFILAIIAWLAKPAKEGTT